MHNPIVVLAELSNTTRSFVVVLISLKTAIVQSGNLVVRLLRVEFFAILAGYVLNYVCLYIANFRIVQRQ
ncbi:hypothetical protein ANTQUA_LOCUS9039 [Anthophora quadrimaculata]